MTGNCGSGPVDAAAYQEALAEHGRYGRATSVFPSLTPVCLSSIATGTHGDVHDIVSRSRELLNARLSGLREQLSELTDLPGYRPDELVTPGENIHVKVLSVDPKKRRVSLSVRQALWS